MIVCIVCDGRGKVWADEPDPIEGHKLSRTIPCPLCKGKQITTDMAMYHGIVAYRDAVGQFHDERNRLHAKRIQEENDAKQLVKGKLADLPKDVIEVLHRADVDFYDLLPNKKD